MQCFSRVQQGNYYSVLYDGDKKETIIETMQELQTNKRYALNGKVFTVKSKKTLNIRWRILMIFAY